jgi:hypothetical protein
VWEVKEGQLVHHCGCHCVEWWWTWDDGERKWWRQVELRWCGALAREKAKWRRGSVVRKVTKVKKTFIVVEGVTWAVWGGWPAAVVQIQCFNFSLRRETTGWSIVQRWSRGSKFIIAPWEGSMTWCGGVTASTGWEATPGRGKRGDDTSCADVNFTGTKNEENSCARFSCYKWTVKIYSNDELI